MTARKGQSTNALACRYAKEFGYAACETVQQAYGGRRHDLFGLIDCIALDILGGRIVFIQNSSEGGVAPHKAKFQEAIEMVRNIQSSGARLEIWEWRRRKFKPRDDSRERFGFQRREFLLYRDGSWAQGPWSKHLEA